MKYLFLARHFGELEGRVPPGILGRLRTVAEEFGGGGDEEALWGYATLGYATALLEEPVDLFAAPAARGDSWPAAFGKGGSLSGAGPGGPALLLREGGWALGSSEPAMGGPAFLVNYAAPWFPEDLRALVEGWEGRK